MLRTSSLSSGRRAFAVCLALALLALPSLAQTVSGTIQGTVTDSSGGALPGVTVTVRNVETASVRVVTTNANGYYNVPFVPIGTYRVTAELSGMTPVEQTNVEVGLNHTRVIDFKLAVGAVEETITVVAEQPRINQVNAEIKQTLTEVEVIDKPTPPGNSNAGFLTLAETFAGFQENPTSGQNNPTSSSGSSINFGNGTRGTTFQINGVNNDDSSENQHRQGVTLSSIKEFQVLTSNFSAEFGRAYGATVLVQTKSGTNEIAGDVFGFHTDAQWNAKSYFSRHLPKPENTRSQYGMTIGGPIMRDRLFAFGTYEENRYEGPSIDHVDLFLPEELSLPRLTRGNDTPENRAFIEDILGRFPQTSPNNPGLSPRAFSTATDINQPDDDYSIRLDWEANLAHHLTARYQDSHQLREATELVIGENAIQDNKQWNFGATWTQVFNDSLVGEFRYGLGYRDTNVTIRSGDDTPVVRFVGTPVASIIGNAGAFPILREQTDHQFVYNLSAMWFENHTLRGGVDIRRQDLDDRADNFHRGFWQFRSTCLGTTYESPYHAFLDGCVSSFWKAYGPNFLENRIDEENVYLEDNWQVLPNLTLGIGARYEHVGEPQEAEDRLDYGFEDDSYVDPRLSFAYTIASDNRALKWLTGGSNRSVIRGGWGSYHGRIFQSIFSQSGVSLRNNPPNSLFKSDFPSSLNIADPTEGFVFTPGTPTARYSFTRADENLEMPSTDQWNLTFEREMPWNSSMRVSYTNKRGEDLLRYVPTNLPQSPLEGPVLVVDHPNNAPREGHPDLRGQTITTVNTDPCAGTGLPGIDPTAQCPNSVPLGDNEISVRVPRTNERRPDPRYGTLTTIMNDVESEYQAVQLEWVKRYSDNLHFQASYTWSEEFDNVSEATFVGAGDTNGTGPNKKYAWGRSRFDTPHRISIYGSYRLPFFAEREDWLGVLLGGWQISPVFRYATGTPFSVIDSRGVDLNWDGFSEARPVVLDRDILGRTIDDPDSSEQNLPRDAFRQQTLGDSIESLVARNAFRIDHTERVDLGVFKNFELPADVRLNLRLEVFNLLDREQFGFPVNDLASASFGRISSMATSYQPRTFQVGLRIMY